MKKFKYIGKSRSAANRILLFPGGIFELPENDKHVKALIAKKLLIPTEESSDNIPKTKKQTKSKTTKSKSEND